VMASLCLSVCLSVCPVSTRVTRKPHGRTFGMLPVAVARSSSDGMAIRSSGFMDDVMLSYHGATGPESSSALFTEEVCQVAVPFGRQITAVFG